MQYIEDILLHGEVRYLQSFTKKISWIRSRREITQRTGMHALHLGTQIWSQFLGPSTVDLELQVPQILLPYLNGRAQALHV